MSINMKMTVQQPDTINLTLTVTMPLRDWNALREQMSSSYPSFRFRDAIADATRRMAQVVEIKDFEIEP